MKRYHGGERVEAGIYWSPRHLAFRSLEEAGTLRGDAGDVFYAVPAIALFVLGPVVGLAYVIFLPLVGFAMLAHLGTTKVREAWRRWRVRHPAPRRVKVRL